MGSLKFKRNYLKLLRVKRNIQSFLLMVGGLAISVSYNACSQNYGIGQVDPVNLDGPNQQNTDPGDGGSDPNDPPGGGGPGTPPVVYINVAKHQDITINPPTNKVDILVIDDNSKSMNFEQTSMAARMSSFLAQIKNLDWQLGIITTDMSDDAYKKDGRLLNLTMPNGSAAPANIDQNILNSTMSMTLAEDLFKGTIQRPLINGVAEGSSLEQGIASAYRAIQRSKLLDVNSAANRRLIRSDAALSVVLITDSDETFSRGTDGVTHTADGLLSFVATTLGAAKTFVYNSIIVKPADKVCLDMPDSENETYGLRYFDLSQKTGGVIGSVCELDYGAQLSKVGETVANSIGSINLLCDPVDINNNNSLLDDIMVKDAANNPVAISKVEGRRVTFATMLPVGTAKIDYFCKEVQK